MRSVTVNSKRKVSLPYLLSYYRTEVWTFYYYLFILDFRAKYCPLNKFIPSNSSNINHFEPLKKRKFVYRLKKFSLKSFKYRKKNPLCSRYLKFGIFPGWLNRLAADVYINRDAVIKSPNKFHCFNYLLLLVWDQIYVFSKRWIFAHFFLHWSS